MTSRRRCFTLEDATFRDAGRLLASSRDSVALRSSLRKLVERFPGRLAQKEHKELRRMLKKLVTLDSREMQAAIAEVEEKIVSARLRVPDWPIQRDNSFAMTRGMKRRCRNVGERVDTVQPSDTSVNVAR